jgi:hypothetical protein
MVAPPTSPTTSATVQGYRGGSVRVHAVTDWAYAVISWRLFLPESWDDRKAEQGR